MLVKFMRFAHLEDAKAAQNLNGPLDIGGRLIKVTIVTFISLARFYSFIISSLVEHSGCVTR